MSLCCFYDSLLMGAGKSESIGSICSYYKARLREETRTLDVYTRRGDVL